MNPVRVTAPDWPVVKLSELKQSLRVSHDDDDERISQLERAAVAHLDGWRGVLGRCILPQTWRLNLRQGTHCLPFPDITEVTGGDWDGKSVIVSADGPVEFTCALPEDAIPAAQDAVTLMVQIRYDNLSGPEYVAAKAALDCMVGPLRWLG